MVSLADVPSWPQFYAGIDLNSGKYSLHAHGCVSDLCGSLVAIYIYIYAMIFRIFA